MARILGAMAAAVAVNVVTGQTFAPAPNAAATHTAGPTVVNAALGGGGWSALWLYLVGPVAGALLATVAFRVQETE